MEFPVSCPELSCLFRCQVGLPGMPVLFRNSCWCEVAVILIACLGMVGCAGQDAPPSLPAESSAEGNPSVPKSSSAPAVSVTDAAWTGDLDALRQHIEAGADLNQKGADGGTPLHAAAARGNVEAAMLLIEGGAEVNARKIDGATPLHTAAFFCHENIVRGLLANGADKMLKNNVGATAYDSVAGPFEQVKPIYDLMLDIMGPLGLQLDYERIQATRPRVAEILSAQ